MITKVEKIAFVFVGLFIVGFFVFWESNQARGNDSSKEVAAKDSKKDKNKKKKKGNDIEASYLQGSPGVAVIQKWDLPSELKEISGIAYINDRQFACVQDELGKIFIFNTTNNKIEKEVAFAEPGDYEGIAVVGSTAYVVSAGGKLFEVANYTGAQPKVTTHVTPLTVKQNVEGLCYDKKNNRLLLSIKGVEPTSKDYKGIYAFDLTTKNAAANPVYKIDLTDDIWSGANGKNKMQPSDLVVHPTTDEIYVIDGASPKLLVLDDSGNEKELYQLSSSDFVQPEGIAFNESGDLFISSEGRSGPGTILKVSIDEAPQMAEVSE